jgi:hypothetical protein
MRTRVNAYYVILAVGCTVTLEGSKNSWSIGIEWARRALICTANEQWNIRNARLDKGTRVLLVPLRWYFPSLLADGLEPIYENVHPIWCCLGVCVCVEFSIMDSFTDRSDFRCPSFCSCFSWSWTGTAASLTLPLRTDEVRSVITRGTLAFVFG